jgi:2-iminobutanoate/2-iminopropanoate deaminase
MVTRTAATTCISVLVSVLFLACAGCGGTPSEPPTPVREAVATSRAPAAIGPYSQAIRLGDTVWLAGQIGIAPDTGEMVAGGIEAETRQVLVNVEQVLGEAGFGFEDVVQVQVFLADLEDYATINRIYGETFEEPFPARAVVEVARLPRDARIEIMATAAR